MPSHAHQSLLLWTVRKMTVDGFLTIACEGSMPQGGAWNLLPPPPEMIHLRPDACGINLETGDFAFGEAKTSRDIDTEHTRKQLRVFAQLVHRRDRSACRFYLAVPRSTVSTLDRVLRQAGLLTAPQLVRLHIPDCLVEDNL